VVNKRRNLLKTICLYSFQGLLLILLGCETTQSDWFKANHGSSYRNPPQVRGFSQGDKEMLDRTYGDVRRALPESCNDHVDRLDLAGAVDSVVQGPAANYCMMETVYRPDQDFGQSGFHKVGLASSGVVNRCLLPKSSNCRRKPSHPCYCKSQGARKSPKRSGFACATGFKKIMHKAGHLPTIPSGHGQDMIDVLPRYGWKCMTAKDAGFDKIKSPAKWRDIPPGFAMVYSTSRHRYGHVEYKVPKGTYAECPNCQFVSDYLDETPYHANGSGRMIGLCRPPAPSSQKTIAI